MPEKLVIAKNVTAVVGEKRIALIAGTPVDEALAAKLGSGKVKSLSRVRWIVTESDWLSMQPPECPAPDIEWDENDRPVAPEPTAADWMATPFNDLPLAASIRARVADMGIVTVGEAIAYGAQHGSLGLTESQERKVRKALESLHS